MAAAIQAVRLPEESARVYAYRVLALYISELLFLPGEKLIEADIASQLGISRTPVRDTFMRLQREKMLLPGKRGAVVPPLCAEAIRQQVWLHRTAGAAILGCIFNRHPSVEDLEPLERIVAAEYDMLQGTSRVSAARYNAEFFAALYRLAGYEPVYRALHGTGRDLYRLFRLAEDRAVWRAVAGRHADLLQALAQRRHEDACRAFHAILDLAEPLLARSMRRYPQYFV